MTSAAIIAVTVCNTEWHCVPRGDGNHNVVRIKDSVIECMGHTLRNKQGPDTVTECYWNAPCKDGKPTEDTKYSWTVDELCKMTGGCTTDGKSKCTGWCAKSRDFLAAKKTCGKGTWHPSLRSLY